MKSFKSIMPFISIFCLALFIRITHNPTVAHNYTPIYDAGLYHTLAQNLVREHCYCLHASLQDISRPPLWPFVLAMVYNACMHNSSAKLLTPNHMLYYSVEHHTA